MASRPPTDREIARDRSAEALARAWLQDQWPQRANWDTGNNIHVDVADVARLIRARDRARDAAWRRVVRTVATDGLPSMQDVKHERGWIAEERQRGWVAACAALLAAAPGARGTKGGRRG